MTQLFTSARLSQMFQASPWDIETELRRSGYEPVFIIDDVPHWGAECVVCLRCHRAANRPHELIDQQ